MKALLLAILLAGASLAAGAADYRPLPGGSFRTALPPDGQNAPALVKPFLLRTKPVSRREFLAFVTDHPQWQKGRVSGLLARRDEYLADWHEALDAGDSNPDAPVTGISWYAARAYCQSESARLPNWYEWEFASAADASRADARSDPAWRERILAWYARPNGGALPAVGRGSPNVWGIYDLHESVWEWVEDFNGLFVTADNRDQGAAKLMEFCGAAALSLGDRENYAILMRIALLAALDARDSVQSLGFRCARDIH